MTKNEGEEMVAYFSKLELPDRIDLPGMNISNCKSFVSSNILRITVGMPVIKDVSYRELVDFRAVLESV